MKKKLHTHNYINLTIIIVIVIDANINWLVKVFTKKNNKNY